MANITNVTMADIALEPHEAFRRMATSGPVVFHEESASWYVTSYYLVTSSLQNDALSARPAAPGSGEQGWRGSMTSRVEGLLDRWTLFNDPPIQQIVRRTMAPAFAKRLVPEWRARASGIAEDLAAGLNGRGFDAVSEYALPLATRNACALLGIPDTDGDAVRGSAVALMRYLGDPAVSDHKLTQAADAVEYLSDYLGSLLSSHRNGEPAVRALGELAEIDTGLADAMFSQLLTGGIDPVVGCLSSAIRELFRTEHEELRELLAGMDDLNPAVDECLRFDAPFYFVTRRAMRPLTIGAVEVPAESRVVLVLAAANRDPQVYADPHAFRLGRDGPRHLSFGLYGHYCLGATLARIVLTEGVRAIVRRFAGSPARATDCATESAYGSRVWRRLRITS